MGRRLTVLLVLLVVLPTGVARLAGDPRGPRRAAAGRRPASTPRPRAGWPMSTRGSQRVLDDRARRLLAMELTAIADTTPGWRELRPDDARRSRRWRCSGRRAAAPPAAGRRDQRRRTRVPGPDPTDSRRAGARQRGRAADRRRRLPRSVVEPAVDHGWVAWYWDTGLHLLFWRRDPSAAIIAVELDRTRLLADLLVELSPAGADDVGRLGPDRPRGLPGTGPVAVRRAGGGGGRGRRRRRAPTLAPAGRVDPPRRDLAGRLGGRPRGLPPGLAGLIIVAAVLGGLAFVFHRESSRELREASAEGGFRQPGLARAADAADQHPALCRAARASSRRGRRGDPILHRHHRRRERAI